MGRRERNISTMPPKFKRVSDIERGPERQALLESASDDDDFFLRGPSVQPSRLIQDNGKITRLQGQVHDVVDVMRDNIGKVMDRGDRLEDLQDKSEHLSTNSDLFQSRAKVLKSTMWWRQCKMRMVIALVVVVLLGVIIVPIIIKMNQK
ncbi:Vesicle-associated membrane protein 4 [Lamellibrachia satsuma]|nr:Vesicle-associated membrane protein 4 [Lamellibrachia satsuma]